MWNKYNSCYRLITAWLCIFESLEKLFKPIERLFCRVVYSFTKINIWKKGLDRSDLSLRQGAGIKFFSALERIAQLKQMCFPDWKKIKLTYTKSASFLFIYCIDRHIASDEKEKVTRDIVVGEPNLSVWFKFQNVRPAAAALLGTHLVSKPFFHDIFPSPSLWFPITTRSWNKKTER